MLGCQAGRSSERAPPPAAVHVWACKCQHRDHLDFKCGKLPKILSAQTCMCAQPSATILGSILVGCVAPMGSSSDDEPEDLSGENHLPFVKAFSECKALRGETWFCFVVPDFFVFQQGDFSSIFTCKLLSQYIPTDPRWG